MLALKLQQVTKAAATVQKPDRALKLYSSPIQRLRWFLMSTDFEPSDLSFIYEL